MNVTNITKDIRCSMCKKGHTLVKCRKFQELPSWRRREQVRKARTCFRCLGPNHSMASCSSTIRCRHCQGEHNSLLHLGAGEVASSQEHSNESDSTSTDEYTNIELVNATIGRNWRGINVAYVSRVNNLTGQQKFKSKTFMKQ